MTARARLGSLPTDTTFDPDLTNHRGRVIGPGPNHGVLIELTHVDRSHNGRPYASRRVEEWSALVAVQPLEEQPT